MAPSEGSAPDTPPSDPINTTTITTTPGLAMLGGCDCYGKAPTVPVFRDRANHLSDCPAKGSGYPVGVFTIAAAILAGAWTPMAASGHVSPIAPDTTHRIAHPNSGDES